MSMTEPLIFEKSKEGAVGVSLPECDVPERPIRELIPERFLRGGPPALPEVPEVEITRHFVRLSQKNVGVDTHFYPLGSCTMKYNPKLNEYCASLSGFANTHPYQPEEASQGILELLYLMQKYLSEIAGMAETSLQPAAGAHGEMVGITLIKAYHDDRKDFKRRKICLLYTS
ncbi:MAG: aminomethyl-transferring glycine dehydrogenase subunit GcvPB, partial [Planctomycetota bacterium]|nr:aminomethyl-transferring glycine dehydrogenase subunit GcvPB [Planctomycetota bacterium]